jgi:hypothetical protein
MKYHHTGNRYKLPYQISLEPVLQKNLPISNPCISNPLYKGQERRSRRFLYVKIRNSLYRELLKFLGEFYIHLLTDGAAQVHFFLFGGGTPKFGRWSGSFSVPHPRSMRSFLVTRAKLPLHKEFSL